MDKSRQQFEEFIKFHVDDAEINNKFETANNGLNYADQHVDLMWIAWEASRESLINSLPESINCPTAPELIWLQVVVGVLYLSSLLAYKTLGEE